MLSEGNPICRPSVGALLKAAISTISKSSLSVLESLQRSEISNPPAFGARIAETILSDEKLRDLWFRDLKTMKEYHIYMAENSRISIAGLNSGNVEYAARSIGEVLAREGWSVDRLSCVVEV
ncbi:hypothetical protein BJX99DRAFT_259016 [Aspergillus californicus]